MVEAYLRGRGQRRELKAAMGAVRRALEAYGATLNKWQRAAGDFRSALELNRGEADARHNAEVVDRWIAKLVDMLRELQRLANAMANQKRDLGDKMKQLKGRMPAQDMPPGAAGDDEDEEERISLWDLSRARRRARPGRERNSRSPPSKPAGCSRVSGSMPNAASRWANPQAEPRNRNRPTW